MADPDGRFRIEVRVPPEADRVMLTAVGSAADPARGGSRIAQKQVSLLRAAGATSVNVGTMRLALGASCVEAWLPTFGPAMGFEGSANVFALEVLDLGNGPELFAGGRFRSANDVTMNGVARWNGTTWEALGTGVGDGDVHALAAFDDGNGPALYAGGEFATAGGQPASNVARWDGSTWSAVGAGLASTVRALAVFDQGAGSELFAGAGALYKWNGSTWSLPAGDDSMLNGGDVRVLVVFDDGGGPALFAGGSFSYAGDVPVENRLIGFGKWDGAAWKSLGEPKVLHQTHVYSMTVFDDGNGPALYAGGSFTMIHGVPIERVARWDGTAWAGVGDGFGDGTVHELAVLDDGGGPALYAGGSFGSSGVQVIDRLAKWDGLAWSAPTGATPGFTTSVLALASLEVGGEPTIFSGGGYAVGGSDLTDSISLWDGVEWTFEGVFGLGGDVRAMGVFDDGTGPNLYVGGLDSIGTEPVLGLAKWDGATWTQVPGAITLDGTFQGTVNAIEVFDDGNGPALYVTGNFGWVDGTVVRHIARWDGSSWSALGGGLDRWAYDLQVFDDGSGPALFVGGAFLDAGGTSVQRVAKWDGASWSAVGTGSPFLGLDNWVRALAVFDYGNGPVLLAGGDSENRVARLSGNNWVSTGFNIFPDGAGIWVAALAVYDDGNGPNLYAGGQFVFPGQNVARWDGSSWFTLGAGMNDRIWDLDVIDLGSGPRLVAGGDFTTAGGLATSKVALWDGSSWSAMGSGTTGRVWELATYDDGNGPALFAGGSLVARDSDDAVLARWGCDATAPQIFCPPRVSVREVPGTPPGEVVTFTAQAADDVDPAPLVEFDPPSGSIFPPGTTTVIVTARDAAGNESTCSFSVAVGKHAPSGAEGLGQASAGAR